MWTTASPASARAPAGQRTLVRIAATRARGLARHLVARGREDVPCRAERVDVLASGVARLLVSLEEVEGLAVVGHLRLPVGALRRADDRRGHAGAGARLATRRDGRPLRGARTEAGALGAGVLLEQVDGATLRVDEDPAEAIDLRQADRRGSAGRVGAAGRGGCLVVAAAAARDHEGHERDRREGEQKG